METYKIMHKHAPISMFSEFTKQSHRTSNHRLRVNIHNTLDISRINFIYKATILWNTLIPRVLLPDIPMENGLIVPGSSTNTELSASIPFAKRRIKALLLAIQATGCKDIWEANNFDPQCNNVSIVVNDTVNNHY